MTSTALGFSAFGVTTRTTRSTLFPEARDVGTCVVAGRRVLVAAFGVIRRTHAANLVALPTTPPDDTSSDAFSAFTCGLGLGEDMITARKELAAEIKKSSSATGLKLLRLEAGLSQRQLAQAVGTSHPKIATIEAGKSGMGFGMAQKIASVLGVTVDQLAAAEGARLRG